MGSNMPKFQFILNEVKNEIQKEKEAKMKKWMRMKLDLIENVQKEIDSKKEFLKRNEEELKKVVATGEVPGGYDYFFVPAGIGSFIPNIGEKDFSTVQGGSGVGLNLNIAV